MHFVLRIETPISFLIAIGTDLSELFPLFFSGKAGAVCEAIPLGKSLTLHFEGARPNT
jgi:hypothetical protein